MCGGEVNTKQQDLRETFERLVSKSESEIDAQTDSSKFNNKAEAYRDLAGVVADFIGSAK
jgi:hypothetical protein